MASVRGFEIGALAASCNGSAASYDEPAAACDGADGSDATAQILRRFVQSSAWQSERALAIARAVFCGALLVRTLLVTAPTFERLATGVPAILATVVFSLVVLFDGERYRQRAGFLIVSVAFDAAAGFVILLPMALWPELPQVPLLDKADISGLLLVIAASAFRHSVRASLVSCGLNVLSFALLMHWDRAVGWSFVERHVALLYVLFLLGMGAVATLLAHRTRVLVTSSARGALEADRAQRNLALILREHHDLRSQLATATINADLAGRELAAMPGRSLQPLIERVRLSLTQINSAVRAIKEQSYESLVELDAPRPVDLKEPIDAVRQELARRFPAVLLDVRLGSDVPAPWVAGGSDGMRRLLLNLAVNACEGSGEKAATLIVIEGASTPGGDTVIVVRDDGPGFTGPVLAAPGVRASSKADGFGIGLSLVRKITELSGGRVNWANDPHGGARVELVLPARPSSRRGALRLSMPED